MANRRRPARGEVEPAGLARLRLHVGHGPDRRGRVGHHHAGRTADQRYVSEALNRVIRLLVERERASLDRRGIAQHQRVAVGGRLRHQQATDAAASARTAVNHHRLAELLSQLHVPADAAHARIWGKTSRAGKEDGGVSGAWRLAFDTDAWRQPEPGGRQGTRDRDGTQMAASTPRGLSACGAHLGVWAAEEASAAKCPQRSIFHPFLPNIQKFGGERVENYSRWGPLFASTPSAAQTPSQKCCRSPPTERDVLMIQINTYITK